MRHKVDRPFVSVDPATEELQMNEQDELVVYACPQCGSTFGVPDTCDEYQVDCPGCGLKLDLTELSSVSGEGGSTPESGTVEPDASETTAESSPSTVDNPNSPEEQIVQCPNCHASLLVPFGYVAEKAICPQCNETIEIKGHEPSPPSPETSSMAGMSKRRTRGYRWPEPGRSKPQFWFWRIPIVGYVVRELLNYAWCILHPSWLKNYSNVDLSQNRHYRPGKAYGWFGYHRLAYVCTAKMYKLVRFDYSDGIVSIENAKGEVLEAPLSELEVKFKYDARNWRRIAIIPLDEGEFYVAELHSTLPHADWDDIFGVLHHAGAGGKTKDKHADKKSFAIAFAKTAVEKLIESV